MGKDSIADSNDDGQLEEFHPGCMWGIIHAFDYHHWNRHVKKMMPHSPKKHNRNKHVKGNRRSGITLNIDDSNEVHSLLDDEEVAGNFLVDGDTKETRSSSKRSIMARIKSLVYEMSKEEKSSLKQQKKLTRTYSIHHLETLNHGPTKGKIAGWRRKVIFLHSKPDSFHPSQIKKTTSQNQSLVNEEEYLDPDQQGKKDILEIFRVNKDLFQKFLYNTEDDDGTTIHTKIPRISDRPARLSKSGSFPQAGMSHGTNVRSSKLNHKIDEVWSFKKKREKLLSSKSGPLRFQYDGESNTNDQEESKFIEEEHVVEEDKYDGSDYGFRRTHLRTSSLQESLDRYIHLLEHSSVSGRDTSCYRSKSLKLRSEYEISSELAQPRISFKRVHSLSHVEFCKEETFFGEMEICLLEEEKEMSSAEEADQNSQTENRNQNELQITDGSDINYVKKILELSGFTANDLFGAWNSSESPLDPSLYEDMETYWPCDDNDTASSFSHHQILFDLTNEAIIQIYDRSYTYYPKALSSVCWVRPLPFGNHFLDEVLACIDRSFNKSAEPDQPVDCIVGRDLAEDYGWMNLQFESECVALEFEELLIDELVDELMYS
ncbi:protein TRM32-like [Impatiens glandulifera]|uniref:protein TRM32-like n=1 Tax=Impatiens glandulifera TaxID=253017 RepID=UPI001FB06258|nr:protein TRM32-like [Impatiens glandulifera]